MLRIIILVALACIACRWALGKWPWDYLRSQSPRAAELKQARSLLGVQAGASRDEVIAAHRRLTAMVHPDRGGSHQAMQEANAARDLLLGEMPGLRDGTGG